MKTRRNMQITLNISSQNVPHKCFNHSPSTEDSSSPREMASQCMDIPRVRNDKEKSQLCKKFLQFGYCPYQKKCKFAHGSHELRKNQQPNARYKTKQCGVFLQEGWCMFGQRCNFIHCKPRNQNVSDCHTSLFQEIKAEIRIQSRLLDLLKEH